MECERDAEGGERGKYKIRSEKLLTELEKIRNCALAEPINGKNLRTVRVIIHDTTKA